MEMVRYGAISVEVGDPIKNATKWVHIEYNSKSYFYLHVFRIFVLVAA